MEESNAWRTFILLSAILPTFSIPPTPRQPTTPNATLPKPPKNLSGTTDSTTDLVTLFLPQYTYESSSSWSYPGEDSNDNNTWNSYDGPEENSTRPSLCGGMHRDTLRWQGYMNLICVPFLTLLGITGNVLSFLVMGSPVYRRKSYSYYLRILAVFDTLTLVTEAVVMGNSISLEFGYGPYLHMHTKLTCKLTNFLESVVFLMSSWVVVAFTCDRYVAVCHPLQRARLCTDTRAKIIVFLLLVAAMISQVFRFIYIDQLPREKPCHAPSNLRLTYFGIHYFWYSFFLRFALPFLILVTCNSLIIFHVQRMQKRRQTDERDKRRRTNLAITTLLVVCAVFVITLFPNAMIALIQFINGKDETTFCVLLKIDAPFQLVRMLNYSTNFILYGLTGRLFRSELHRLLTCRRYTSSPNNSSKKIKVKVNFQAVGSRLPVLVATPGDSCPRVARGTLERKLYLGRFDRERESEL